MHFEHRPVMRDEVLALLALKPNDQAVDATVGLGGHAEAMLDAIAPKGRLLAIDRDDRNIDQARARLMSYGKRVEFVHDSYAHLDQHCRSRGFDRVAGILMDLGFSSAHVDDASRGFSFQHDGPLDMRYDTRQSITAAEIINEWSAEDLADVIKRFGEELQAHRIVAAIIAARRRHPIERTIELAEIIESVVSRHGRIHPATRTFQALRMAVNDELGELIRGLDAARAVLQSGGRLVVLTFHSGEDRIVKRWMKDQAARGDALLTKHVLKPSQREQKENPRSRSAKLRGLAAR